jgi:arylsulfatase A-like enzyme
MTMLTSLRVPVHGVDGPGRRLAPGRTTLAEQLRNAGYDTAAFVGAPTLSSAFGFDRGFGRYENWLSLPDSAKPPGRGPDLPADVLLHTHDAKPARDVAEAASAWMAHHAHAPFFAFVHLWDPHYDYHPKAPYDRLFDPDYAGDFDFDNFESNPAIVSGMPEREKAHLIALYDGEIASTDAIIGGIVRTLERAGLLDETLVVVTADHGEEFFDHAGKGHVHTLFQEIVHVPLIFRYPRLVPAGRRVDAVFGAAHVMTTILGLVGLPSPPNLAARDLSALVRGGAPPPGLWAFAETAQTHPEPFYLVRIGDFALLGTRGPSEGRIAFDVRLDPLEHRGHPMSAAKARVFDRYVDGVVGGEASRGPLPSEATLDGLTIRQLIELGYVEK